VHSVALPTAAVGGNQAFTLTGNATVEGALALSPDGSYLTLAGYAVAPGVATSSATRVIARVDAMGTIDTTTTLGSSAFTNNIRGAVTDDGDEFWICGSGSGGMWYELLGSNGGNQLMTSPGSTRVIEIVDGQLYGTASSSGFTSVFAIGSGLPETLGQTATPLAGMTSQSGTPSPYGFAFFDRTGVSGLDTVYVADDRATASGGGIQKWTSNGTTWTLQATFKNGITTGVRGLAGEVVGAQVVLYATTTETSANKLVRVVDDGTSAPAIATIATAPANTVYHGVAMAWSPPVFDQVFADGFE